LGEREQTGSDHVSDPASEQTQAHEVRSEPARDDSQPGQEHGTPDRPEPEEHQPTQGDHDQRTMQFPRPPNDEDIHPER
jgi:hypothetical protein